jgi:nucleotide-binding universal stress UspA family protein
MTMHIVVGVDESEGAAEALRWAVREADARGAVLTAVLVWGWLDQHRLDRSEPFDPAFDEDDALGTLERVVARTLGDDVPPGIRLRAVNALAGSGLVEAAADADLLVVGARGLGGFKGLLVGSVSQHCLHHAPCPVAVVKPADGPRGDLERIVVGVDGSATSLRALDWGLDAARAHSARVTVVHAWHPSYVSPMDAYLISSEDVIERAAQTLLDEAVDQADGQGLAGRIDRTLVMGTAARAVLETAEGADVIVVGSRQQSVAGWLFLGSVSLQVTHHAECPVVVVPPED